MSSGEDKEASEDQEDSESCVHAIPEKCHSWFLPPLAFICCAAAPVSICFLFAQVDIRYVRRIPVFLAFQGLNYNEICDFTSPHFAVNNSHTTLLRTGLVAPLSPRKAAERQQVAISVVTILSVSMKLLRAVFTLLLAPSHPFPNLSAWNKENRGESGISFEEIEKLRSKVIADLRVDERNFHTAFREWDKGVLPGRGMLHELFGQMSSEAEKIFNGVLCCLQRPGRFIGVKLGKWFTLDMQLFLFTLQLLYAVVEFALAGIHDGRLFWGLVWAQGKAGFSMGTALFLRPSVILTWLVRYSNIVISVFLLRNFYREFYFNSLARLVAQLFIVALYPLICPCLSLYFILFQAVVRLVSLWLDRDFLAWWMAPLLVAAAMMLLPFAISNALHMSGLCSEATFGATYVCTYSRVVVWNFEALQHVRHHALWKKVTDFAFTLSGSLAGISAVLGLGWAFVRLLSLECFRTIPCLVNPASVLWSWLWTPEYYSTGWHFDYEDLSVVHVFGKDWWRGLFGLVGKKVNAYDYYAFRWAQIISRRKRELFKCYRSRQSTSAREDEQPLVDANSWCVLGVMGDDKQPFTGTLECPKGHRMTSATRTTDMDDRWSRKLAIRTCSLCFTKLGDKYYTCPQCSAGITLGREFLRLKLGMDDVPEMPEGADRFDKFDLCGSGNRGPYCICWLCYAEVRKGWDDRAVKMFKYLLEPYVGSRQSRDVDCYPTIGTSTTDDDDDSPTTPGTAERKCLLGCMRRFGS